MPDLIVLVVATISGGYLLRKLGLLPEDAAKHLNLIVFYLTLPALIFNALHRAELQWSLLWMPLIAWATCLLGLALGWASGKLLRLSDRSLGSWMLAIAFANTTFFGYPIIEGFFGQHHLTLAIFYDLLGATLAVNTIGALVGSRMSGGTLRPGEQLTRLLRFPPLWGLVLGLGLHGLVVPPLVEHLIDRLGGLTTPLIMLSIGLSLQFRHATKEWPLTLAASFARLVLIPAIVWLVLGRLGLPVAFQQAAVMQSAMPSMLYAFSLALLFGLEIPLVINTIVASIVLSFVTLPLWHWILVR
ncbi:MAG TPA: AEC family transporter [Stenomitos sp.]